MKKFYFFLLSFVFLSLLTCKREQNTTQKTSQLGQLVSDNLPEIISSVKSYQDAQKNVNSTLSMSIEPNYDVEPKIKKLINGAENVFFETKQINIGNDSIGSYRAFAFLRASGKIVGGRIVEIYGNLKFIQENKDRILTSYNDYKISGFDGAVFTYDIFYRPLRNRNYKDGKVTTANSGFVKGRTSTTNGLTTLSNNTIKVNCDGGQVSNSVKVRSDCSDVYWVTTYTDGHQTWVYLYSYCDCDGGGSGGGTGPGPISPINTFKGFPANPIKGQVYVYIAQNNVRTEFTWNTDLNIWLAPEVQILADLGYTLAYQTQPPTFDPDNVLTAVALPLLLTPDPTQATKIILAGTAVVLVAAYVYNIVKWSQQQDKREDYCQSYLVPCVNYYSYTYDCRSCYNYCINEGQWYESLCPGITPQPSQGY